MTTATATPEVENPAPTTPAVDPDILAILEQETASTAESSDPDKKQKQLERKRNIDRMRQEAIHMMSIAVHKGTQKRALDVSSLKLELHDSLVQAVLDNGARLVIDDSKQVIEMPVFPELVAKAIKLEGKRGKLQRKMLYAEPYWFVFDTDLDEIWKGVDEMYALHADFLAEVTEPEAYKQAKIAFLTALKNILIASKRVTKKQLGELLSLYATKFPTVDQIKTDFRISVEGPIRVPSLIEQSQEDANLAESLAKQAQAEASQHESASKKALNDKYLASIQQALFEIAPQRALEKGYEAIAEVLKDLEKFDPNKANNRLMDKLRVKFEELQTFVNFNDSLEELVEQTRQLSHVTTSSVSREVVQERFDNFRAYFKESVDLTSDSKGHKALADWMMI